MSEDSGEKREGFWWRLFNQTWYRGGREADITNVPVGKLQEAAEKRGVRIDLTESRQGTVKAKINKIVVGGDDEE